MFAVSRKDCFKSILLHCTLLQQNPDQQLNQCQMVLSFQIITLVNPKPPVVQYEPMLILACTEYAEEDEEDYHRAISVSHPCGRSTSLSYTDSIPDAACATTFTRAWTVSKIT